MINNITNWIDTTSINTWITAFLIEAASVGRTIIICNAFGISTYGSSIYDTTKTIYIAWIGQTWIYLFFSNWSAFNKWIAGCLTGAWANWWMVYSLTYGTETTNIRTRINTFIVYTGLRSWTIWTNYTFWMTACSIWITKIAWNTFTDRNTALISTNCVDRAWWWIAWIFCRIRWNVSLFNDTLSECITGCTWWASANWNVIWYCTDCFDATYSNAWILTFVSDTSFAHWTIRIASTFWSTSFVRVSMIITYAFANCMAIFGTASCIIAARRWEANIVWYRSFGLF